MSAWHRKAAIIEKYLRQLTIEDKELISSRGVSPCTFPASDKVIDIANEVIKFTDVSDCLRSRHFHYG